MQVRRISVAAAAATAAVLFSAPLASAVEGGVVSVTPSSARPGQTVTISATGCITASADAIARAYSDAFPTATLNASAGSGGSVTGTSTVFSGAKPGTYTVNVVCDIKNGSGGGKGTLTVLGKGNTMPHGGARTGLGGSITSGSAGETALGATLVAAAVVAAGAYGRRRRASGTR
ncbi:hypothetical protein K7472_07785 [Streptomyces sp. PTM05]|uniref:Integral membrane protein n=1 Tax=Streptantibioticus parmotrematis TaxID=2873249 RepID=A0ABS7QQU7_9ACTN|nr:hypothetical protein [Streptantibioticus parmotrematis]MBY8884745.1 hypothetical protein [Streptantibioticus parmotrematis]